MIPYYEDSSESIELNSMPRPIDMENVSGRNSVKIRLKYLDKSRGDYDLNNLRSISFPNSLILTRSDRYIKRAKGKKKIDYQRSLSTLAMLALRSELSKSDLNLMLESVREETCCLTGTVNYISKLNCINMNNVTNSYMDLMERYIMGFSLDNPPTFKGNLASLVLDVGTLSNTKLYDSNLIC